MINRKLAVWMGCLAMVAAPASFGLSADDVPSQKIIGRPEAFQQGKRAVFGLWYEDGEWFLRVTSKKDNDRMDFTGVVLVEGDRIIGEFTGLEKAKKKKDEDRLVPHKSGKGFDFKFSAHGKTDGVSFKVGKKATAIKFKLFVGGDDDPKKILIGAMGVHPPKSEFTLPAHPEK